MAVTNVNPASGQTLTWNASFSFDVPDGLSSYLVRVTADGGVLESVYDSGAGGAANGYSVQVEDLGATLRFTVTRDAGWSDDPMTVHVTEDTTTTTWTYDIFPTATYPEGFRPYNDQAEGSVTGVLTFEGRSGNVVSAAGDYNSDEVTNASTVAGSTVSDALETLDGKVTGVSSVFGRSGAVVAAASDYDASQVDNDSTVTGATVKDALESLDAGLDSITEDKVALNNQVGTPTVTTQEDLNSVTGNVSRVNGGGVISDDGDGTVTVSAGSGFIRATDQDDAVFYKVTWAATPLTPTDNQLSYIYYEWNSGTPQMVITTTKRTDLNTNIFIGTVHRAGTFLHPTTHVTPSGNVSTKLTKRFNDVYGLTRASGSVTSEVGTRNIAITQGTWWHGLDESTIAAVDTSVSDTITTFYRDGVGGWTVTGGVTQIPNEYYDDGSGTLALLSANRYGVYWVYQGVDNHTYMLYGRGDYTSAQWPDSLPPGDIPPHMQEQHAGIVARIVVQKGASVFTDLTVPWDFAFSSSGVSDHGDLAGLGDDDHTQYVLADGSRNQVEVLLDEQTTKTGTPSSTQAIFWADDHANGQRLRWSRGRYPDDFVIPFANSFSNTALVYWSGVTGQQTSSSLFTYSSANGRLWLNQAGAGLRIQESATLTSLPGVGNGTYWVKNDVPATPQFTGDDDVAHQLAYKEDHPDVDGTVLQDAVYFTERADHVNAPAATLTELWVRNSVLQTPIFTDDLAIDWVIGRSSDTAITSGQIPFWSLSSGKYFNGSADFSYDSSTDELRLAGDTAALRLTERASAPTNVAGTSFLYVRNTSPSQLRTVDDTGVEAALVQRPGRRYEYDSTTTPGGISSGLVRFNNATVSSSTSLYIYYTDKDGSSGPYQDFHNIEPGATIRFVREDDPTQHISSWVGAIDDAQIGEGPSYADLTLGGSWNASTSWTNPSDGDKFYVDLIPAQAMRESLAMEETTTLNAEIEATGRGWLWNANTYANPTNPQNALDAGGHDPTWKGSDGTESNLAWQERNLPLSMGATLWHRTSASINAPAGGTSKTVSDGNVSYIWDDLANRWYHSYFDASLGDYFVTDSPYGYVWSTRKLIDSSTTSGDMSWIATDGTICACACDSLVYKSTDLTVANLAYTSAVPSATESTMMFYHTGSSLWVHVGYSGTYNYIHTSPDLTTWTQRGSYLISTYGHIVSGDISRDPYNLTDNPLERLCLFSTTYSGMWYSDNATTWTIDTTSQAHGGLQVAHYCPGLWTQDGRGGWMGINSLGDIWYSAQYGGGSWSDSTYDGGTLWKSPEGYQGWCNAAGTASNTTVYSVHSVDNNDANVQHYTLVGYLRGGHSMMHDSDSALNRGVYRWGNGVSVYDRYDDAQTIVGRTGPIRK